MMQPTTTKRGPGRSVRILLLILVGLVFAATQDRYLMRRLIHRNGPHESVHWLSSFSDAVSIAEREKRPIYMEFGATWCGPCKEMLQETYSDTDVAHRLNSEFVPVLIDIDKQPELAAKFSVGPIPDGAFLASDGRQATRNLGFRDADEFLGLCDEAKAAVLKLPPGTPPPSRPHLPGAPPPMPAVPLGFP